MTSLERVEWALRGALWLAKSIDLLPEHVEGLEWALAIVEAERAGRL